MKLMIASYNNGASTWNAEAEETSFLHYRLVHRFNEPAEAIITIADGTGTKAQMYNADGNDVYLGAGKVTIEDPTGTDIFYGRIMEVRGNTTKRTVTLYCQDWLSQLDEEQITYDMREPLDDAGLRQSEVKSDVDDECEPVTQTFIYAKALDGAAYTTETTEANDDTANDMTLLPAAPAVNDCYYFGFDAKETRLNINIGTAGVGVWTLTWYYKCGDGDFELENGSDGTSGFTVSGISQVTWTDPAAHAWTQEAVDGLSKYWIYAKVTAYTSITTQPLGTQAWVPQSLYDDDMTFDADEWNGKYLIFPNEAVGDITIDTGPYADTVVCVGGPDTDAGSYANLWVDDTNKHTVADDAASILLDYDFHINAEFGSLYSAGPTAGRLIITFMNKTAEAGVTRKTEIKIKSAAESYYVIDTIDFTDATTEIRRKSVTIPLQYLTGFIDTLGEATIQFDIPVGIGHTSTLEIYYLRLELDYTVTGTSSSYYIVDTLPNEIITDANLTYEGLGIWEGCPYSVIKEIYKHIDSDTGTLITDGDTMVTLTCAGTIEHTTEFSARQYKDKTRLAILQDLGIQDKAEFWIPLATTTVNWKSTWNDGVADQTITDTDANAWEYTYNYQTLVNKAKVYGMRIGDNELTSSYSDSTSIAKYKATRTKIEHDSGIVSEYDTLARATALVNQYKDVQMIITGRFRGNTATSAHPKTMVLGDEVQITSTYLGLTNAWYIVQNFEYNSESHMTTLLLHPRVSATGLQREEYTSIEIAQQKARRGQEKYIPKPSSHTVA